MSKISKLFSDFLQRRPSVIQSTEQEERLEKDAVVVSEEYTQRIPDHNGQTPSHILMQEQMSNEMDLLQLSREVNERRGEIGEGLQQLPSPTSQQQQQQQQILMQFSNIKRLHFGSVYNFSNLGTTEPELESECWEKKNRFPPKYRKTKSIVAMMEDSSEPNHRILDTVANHLGCDWKSLMRQLGFSEGQITQAYIDHHPHGQMKEVIYQLLLDWVRNADDEERTVGHLVGILWRNGQKECVHRIKEYWKREQS